MQFLVVAFDYADGQERRMAVREQHLKLIQDLKAQGHCLYAAQLVNDNNTKIIGSSMIFDYPTKEALEEMLKEEPYTKNNVWEEVQITRCNVPAFFSQ